MGIDLEAHRSIYGSVKRAIEQALFNYTIPAVEIYEAALIYEKKVDVANSEHGEGPTFEDQMNVYAKSLMKMMRHFCVNDFKSLSLSTLAPIPKVYDEIYLQKRWRTQFAILQTIHVEVPEVMEREKLLFSEVVLYLTLLVAGGKTIKALKNPINTPSQKSRAKGWLKGIAQVIFSEEMQKEFRTILLRCVETELIREYNETNLSIIKDYLLPENKIVDIKNNLYRTANNALEKGTAFPEERFIGATKEETETNRKRLESMQEKCYFYFNMTQNVIWTVDLITSGILPTDIPQTEWKDDEWFLKMLLASPQCPEDLSGILTTKLSEVQRRNQRLEGFRRRILQDIVNKAGKEVSVADRNVQATEEKGQTDKEEAPCLYIYDYSKATFQGYDPHTPTWHDYQEACWLAKVITTCVEAATKEACQMLSVMPRTQVYATETLYDYLQQI